MADLMAVYANRLEENPSDFRRKVISASLAPTGADRQTLEDRREDLRASLAHDPRAVAAEVAKLLATFPSYGMDANAARQTIALYVEALEGVPVWAVERARRRFAKGQAKVLWDCKSCPSAAQLVGESKYQMLEVEDEIHRLGQILDALVIESDVSEEDRQKALAHWAEVKRGILAHADAGAPRNLQVEGLRESNDRFRLREHAELARAGETVPVAADGMTISRALLDSNRRYAAERGITAPHAETEDA